MRREKERVGKGGYTMPEIKLGETGDVGEVREVGEKVIMTSAL